jgi:hypothetical protein
MNTAETSDVFKGMTPVDVVAEKMGKHRRTIQNWAKGLGVRIVKVGRTGLLDDQEWNAALRNQGRPPRRGPGRPRKFA